MNNTLEKAILDFTENSSKTSQVKNVANLLWNEIIEAVKGQQSSKYMGYVFEFEYPGDNRREDRLPDEIAFNRRRKDFNSAIEELFRHLLTKIEERHENTISALIRSKKDRTRWIRSTLGMVLVNKIFGKEIQSFKNLKDKLDRRIETWKSTDEYKNIEPRQREEAEALKRQETWKMISSSDVITEVPLVVKKEGQEGPYFEDRQDALALQDFWQKYFEDLEDEGTTVDIRKWQHEAFFWRPGNKFQGKNLTGEKSDRSVYIAFFYSWLRRCSHATFDEIAKEADVNKSTVSRNWKPHPALEKPFPDPSDDTAGWLDEIFEYPVYFHSDARTSLGMYEPKIRCYHMRDYCEQRNNYPLILRRKKILWDIYCLLLDPETVRASQHCYDAKTPEDFSFEVVAGSEIGISTWKAPSPFIHITKIGVDDA